MTISLEDTLEIAWAKVTPELKERIKAAITKEQAEHVLDNKGEFFHMTGGMAVRNHLRKTIPDADLPSFDEYYGEGTDVRNWDDYYDNALLLAAGRRG